MVGLPARRTQRSVGPSARSRAPPPPFDRNDRPLLPPASAAPEPPVEVENLGRETDPHPEAVPLAEPCRAAPPRNVPIWSFDILRGSHLTSYGVLEHPL